MKKKQPKHLISADAQPKTARRLLRGPKVKNAGARVAASGGEAAAVTAISATAEEKAAKKPFFLWRLMDTPWPRHAGHGWKRQLWNALFLAGGCLLAELLLLLLSTNAVTASSNGVSLALFASYLTHPMVLLLNLLPLLLIAVFLYSLTGRVETSVGVPTILVTILTLINAVKINLRGDPFLFTDIFLAGEAGDMMETYSVYFSAPQILCLVGIVALLFVLVLFTGKARMKGHWIIRLATAALSAGLAVALVFSVYTNVSFYKATYAGQGIISTRSDAQWYEAHGFTYAFLHSAVKEEKAPVVDEEAVAAAVDTYEAQVTGIPDDKKVNIIAVQLEAYCDLSDYLDNPAIEEVYAPIHAIEAQSISGDLVTNICGGGTVDTERSFITGYSVLPDFTTRGYNSYAWYLRSQGYTTEFSHPGNAWFYDRDIICANLGFENLYFSENYYEDLVSASVAPWHSDDVFLDEIVNLMDAAEGPYFSLNITYQNHGPYEYDHNSGDQHLTEADLPNAYARNLINNYLNLVSTSIDAIVQMVERLEAEETPVVLVMFGDHKPYLGGGNVDAYAEAGINMDVSTDEGFYNYYSTPYFIWANSAAKAALDNDFVGDGGRFGSCFLMNKVFELCGWTGDAFMQASNEVFQVTSVLHSAVEIYFQDNAFVDVLSSEDQEKVDSFLAFQYYWKTHFLYGDEYVEPEKIEAPEPTPTPAVEEPSSPVVQPPADGNSGGNGGDADPTPKPSTNPTPNPTYEPTPRPTTDPTPTPTEDPTPPPTDTPDPQPTEDPTPPPTVDPTPQPTDTPDPQPTQDPTPPPSTDPTPPPSTDPDPQPSQVIIASPPATSGGDGDEG